MQLLTSATGIVRADSEVLELVFDLATRSKFCLHVGTLEGYFRPKERKDLELNPEAGARRAVSWQFFRRFERCGAVRRQSGRGFLQ